MIPYIVFIVVIFLLLCKVKKEKYNLYDMIVILILILFSGLRYGIGTDYILYEKMYLNNSLAVSRTGNGYYYLSLLLFEIFPNSAFPLFFLISLITCIGLYIFCRKNSINPALSIFLFITLGYYTTSFNIFRQMLSVSLFLLGYTYFDTKKIMSFIFLVLSTLMHNVAVIAIIVLIFVKIYKKIINTKLILIAGLIGFILYSYVFPIVINKVPSLSIYLNQTSYQSGVGTYLMILVYFIFFIVICMNKKRIVNLSEKNKEFINLFSLGFIIMIFGMKNILFMRLSYYLNIFIILLIPELYNLYKLKNKKVEKLMLYSCFILYFIIFVYSFGEVVPYKTILFL